MPIELEFTDDEIALTVRELGLDLSGNEDEIVKVLRCEYSCDVQAGPGSGKTTILIAKLSILARRWVKANCGICVLSHTNAARIEIEDRMNQSAGLRKLLRYPHFIGTFQSFADQLIALPYLRECGIGITAIDNERFSARAIQEFFETANETAKIWLKNTTTDKERGKKIIGGLRFTDGDLNLGSAFLNKSLPKEKTETGKALQRVKTSLAKQGYFRYDDIYAIAERALKKLPYLAIVLRKRFPWIFIDELQDTSTIQDNLVERIFSDESSTIQRFGDKNQAIFDFDEEDHNVTGLFDRRETLFLSSTRRFGLQIAKFVSNLTAVEPQILDGNDSHCDRRHTVFVYDRDAVGLVVPRFGDLVLNEVASEVWRCRDVYVVGSRKNERKLTVDRFPLSLRDYWADFASDVSTKPKAPNSMIGYVLQARKQFAVSGLGQDAFSHSVDGVIAALRITDLVRDSSIATSRSELRKYLRENDRISVFQGIIWNLVRPDVQLKTQAWKDSMREIVELLGDVIRSPLSQKVKTFLDWHPPGSEDESHECASYREKDNIYVHRSGNARLPIRFDSIHAVKGMTHAATLVVETCINKQHDIKALVPVLTGRKHGSLLRDDAHGHCKRIFVGMSRPSHLLCLALYKDHVSLGDLNAIERNGWRIEHVRVCTSDTSQKRVERG
jgi:ATP-dependent DNA helicase UvrD/PcrA